jgi:hypothetical protein
MSSRRIESGPTPHGLNQHSSPQDLCAALPKKHARHDEMAAPS